MGERTGMRPRVVVENGQPAHIELGFLVKGLLVAGAIGAISTVFAIVVGFPALAGDVEDNAKSIVALEKSSGRVQRNQIKLDERLRRQESQQEWANSKLDALLYAAKVTKRIPQPQVPESTLEHEE